MREGGFESGLTEWEDWGNTSVTANEADARSGSYAAIIGSGDADAEGGAGWYIDDIAGGQTFTISAWGKASPGETAIVGVKSLNGAAVPGSTVTLSFSGQEYERQSIVYTAAAGATQLLIYIYKNPGAGYAYIDDISVIRDTVVVDPPEAVHPHNHAYLPEDWFYNPQSDQTIVSRVNQLKNYSIEYQFANIGTLRADGTIDPLQSDELGHWIKVARETDPGQKIIAWINGNTERHLHVGSEEDRADMHARIIASLKQMVDTGFMYEGEAYHVDGIQFDIEPLRSQWRDDPQLLSLLQGIRDAVGPDVHLSIATPAWDIVWSNEYITAIANVMDMLNPMIYDTNGPDSWKPYVTQSAEEYQALWKATALRYSAAIAASDNPDCQYAPIMPAYDTKGYNETNPNDPEFGKFIIYHDPYIENIYNAARGLKQAMAEGANVYGSGLFWWGTFILEHPDPRDNQDYAHAREWWVTEWLMNGQSDDAPAPIPVPETPDLDSNIVQNGSFESGTSYWEDWGFVDIVPDSAPGSGSKASRIGLEEGGMGQVIAGIEEGIHFTLSGWGKVDVPGDEAIIGIDCLNNNPGAGGANKIPGGKFAIRFDGTEYEQKSLNFVTVPGTTKIQIYIYKETTAGGYAYLDGIQVIASDAPPPSGPPADQTKPEDVDTNKATIQVPSSAIVKEVAGDNGIVTKVSLTEGQLDNAFRSLQQNLQQNGPERTPLIVTVQIAETDGTLEVRLPAASLAKAAAGMPDASISLQYPQGSYTLPLRVIDLERITKKLGGSGNDVTLRVMIGPAASKLNEQLAGHAGKLGYRPLIDALEYKLIAEAGGRSVEIDDFGKAYAERSVVIAGQADGQHETVALYDPDADRLLFVPALFAPQSDGSTNITFRRNGNSVYTILSVNRSFGDAVGHWAQNDIELLASKLVVTGLSPSSFAPDRAITRAEWAAMLVRSLGLNASVGNASFADVGKDDWFFEVVGQAVQAGLANGFDDGTFRPNDPVTREQMAAMISRAIRFISVEGTEQEVQEVQDGTSPLARFSDKAAVSEWATADVERAASAGIVIGNDDRSFAPQASASRAQAVVMIKRLLQYALFIN